MNKIPVVSKSYFDCVEYIIKAEEKVVLETFMEFGRSDGPKHSIITKECRQEYRAAKDRVYRFWHAEEKIKDACEVDIKENCGSVQSGNGLITSCLWDVKNMPSVSLAPPCEESLNTLHVPVPSAISSNTTQREEAKEETHVEKEQVHAEEEHVRVEKDMVREDVTPEEVQRKEERIIDKPQPWQSNRPTSKESGEEPEKLDSDVQRKLREAEAKIQLAEEAAAHAAQQSRNLVVVVLLVCAVYVVSRKTVRKKLSSAIRKLRRDSKGEHLG
jgi:hypothetical protein